MPTFIKAGLWKKSRTPLQGELELERLIQQNSPIPPDPRPYKVYTALLTQEGENAPVATVLENTIGDIVWSREGAGRYVASLDNGFSSSPSKNIVICQQHGLIISPTESNSFEIASTKDFILIESLSAVDLHDWIYNGYTTYGYLVEIRVYN